MLKMKTSIDTPESTARCVQPIVRPRMFVRMFKPQFARLVEMGIKRQTVRPTPKRMPLRGDRISLRAWSDKPYRSPQRILREAVISEVVKIRIEKGRIWLAGQSHLTKYPHRSSGDQTLDSFAMADGFESWEAMEMWFQDQHGLPFEGVLIQWTNESSSATRPDRDAGAESKHGN